MTTLHFPFSVDLAPSRRYCLAMARFPLDKKIKRFAARFNEAGHSLYVVGGAVRDHLLGIPIEDYDFTTDARPEEVVSLFRRVIPTGIEHGTVSVHWEGELYEVTTFRSDGAYLDSRHPSHVDFITSLEEDLKRRDFTINAFAVDCTSGQIIDLNGGYEDLKARQIRAIGNPEQRFDEDGLRILRAARIAAKIDFVIEARTLEAMRAKRDNLLPVSAERIREELFKLVGSDHPRTGLEYLRESGVLSIILPELMEGDGIEQGGMHRETVLEHAISCCEASVHFTDKPEVRFAALLHDIGKSRTVQQGEGRFTFIGHETVGREMARAIMLRLKASGEQTALVEDLVVHHMFFYESSWTDSAVRRFIKRVTLPRLADLFALRLADHAAIHGSIDGTLLDELKARIEAIVAEGDALTVKDLAIGGNELMALGIPKGPLIGAVLEYLLETVLDDPSQNTSARLTTISERYFSLIKTS